MLIFSSSPSMLFINLLFSRCNLSDAIRDYVAMMVNGVKDEPWTEMSFT